ncbi:MAG: ABC transporter permease [Chloroflexi bacterium]|nr:MAG: ABC transporter permease [Chloroflexota bacterium]
MARAPRRADEPEAAPDLTAAPADVAAAELPPEVVAQSLGDYARGWSLRIRSGESGVLPVIVALVIIAVVFQSISNGLYLTPGNIVNLFQQSAVFMVLAMAEGFALILGEIDLSIGYVGAVGAAITVQLVQPGGSAKWPWWAAIAAGLAFCTAFGALQGTLITRLRLPSFIVTLAGFLIGNGLMLIVLLLAFSGFPSLSGSDVDRVTIYNLMWGAIDPTVSVIAAAAVVVGVGGWIWWSDARRRRSGLVAPPPGLSVIKIVLIGVTAAVVVAICNQNRALEPAINEGVPCVIPSVLGVFAAWTILLTRTRYGRYVYAIGGNPEAARRAGVNLAMVRTVAFALCALTAGVGMLLFASYLGGMSNNVNGGSQVLYAVAAAVIGGTSLFGGRGKPLHGLLGGLVIGAIYNGMYLQSLDVKYQFIVTGLVLLAAVTIDSVSRRGSTSGSVARI